MPGNIQNESSSGTLPWSLSTHFVEDREWKALISEYKDGSSQRAEQVSTSRRSFGFDKRLSPGTMAMLRSFYLAHVGRAFKVYLTRADYDAANSDFSIMRFEGGWSESLNLGRWTTSVALVEVA